LLLSGTCTLLTLCTDRARRLLGLPEGTPVEMVTLLRLMFDEPAAPVNAIQRRKESGRDFPHPARL
jgi:hypothetical protein